MDWNEEQRHTQQHNDGMHAEKEHQSQHAGPQRPDKKHEENEASLEAASRSKLHGDKQRAKHAQRYAHQMQRIQDEG